MSEFTGYQLFKLQFMERVKDEGTPDAYEKSLLVIMFFNDSLKLNILTQSPNAQRASKRSQSSLTVSDKDQKVILRDVVHAFLQAETKLCRKIFIKPLKILGYQPDVVFLVINSAYRILKSGNHCLYAYHRYHTNYLKMVPSIYGPYLLYTKEGLSVKTSSKSAARCIACSQTDKTAYRANETFCDPEKNPDDISTRNRFTC